MKSFGYAFYSLANAVGGRACTSTSRHDEFKIDCFWCGYDRVKDQSTNVKLL